MTTYWARESSLSWWTRCSYGLRNFFHVPTKWLRHDLDLLIVSHELCDVFVIVRGNGCRGRSIQLTPHVYLECVFSYFFLQMLRGQDGEIQERGDWNATSLGAIPSSDGPRLPRQRLHRRRSVEMLLSREARDEYFAQQEYSSRNATGIRRRQLRHSRARFLMHENIFALFFFMRGKLPKLVPNPQTMAHAFCNTCNFHGGGGDYALHLKFVRVNHTLTYKTYHMIWYMVYKLFNDSIWQLLKQWPSGRAYIH